MAISGRFSIGQVMKLTGIAALSLTILHGGDETLRSPLLFFLFAMLNIALVQVIVFGKPIRSFLVISLAVGAVCFVAFTVLLTSTGPGRGLQSVIVLGLALGWVTSLLFAYRVRPRAQQSPSWRRGVMAFFDGMGLSAATALGLVLMVPVLRSLTSDLGDAIQIFRGAPQPRGRTIGELLVHKPSVAWALVDARAGHMLHGTTIDKIVMDPTLSWSLSGIGTYIRVPEAITPWWALFDPGGPCLALRIVVDLIAMSPLLVVIGVAILALRVRPPRLRWQEVLEQPGFWACLAPILALLSLVPVGPLFGARYSPLLPSGAVGIAWLALAVTRRWHPEPSWIDRLGRALGLGWLVIFLLGIWAIREGLLL
jgi:hypothetical protein